VSKWVHVGLVVAVIHGGEDVLLLSVGRFLPVPIWALYPIGIAVSAIVMTKLIQWFTSRMAAGPGSEEQSEGEAPQDIAGSLQ
jgi:hypothetical protein